MVVGSKEGLKFAYDQLSWLLEESGYQATSDSYYLWDAVMNTKHLIRQQYSELFKEELDK